MRQVLSWKFVFYELILPALRRFDPARGDAVLGWLGRFVARILPGRRALMAVALRQANDACDASWPIPALLPRLAADAARFQARDYSLEGLDDPTALSRFDVRGSVRLVESLRSGRGAILVGCHFGAHIAGIHWLYRRGIPVRVLAQRPRHISTTLDRNFDSGGPHPQSGLFLRRNLPPVEAAQRVLLARDAIRDGMAVYMNGDIPWNGRTTRVGRILGQAHGFLATWIDLALLTGAPVFWIFCTHEPAGRFALDIEPMETIRPGEEDQALGRYLAELNARIANDPTEAVAHLLWPCYAVASTEPDNDSNSQRDRPSRRKAVTRLAPSQGFKRS